MARARKKCSFSLSGDAEAVADDLVVLGLCLVFASSVAAQQKQEQALSKRERPQKLYPELMRTFDLAEAAPAPLRALALLRIASFPANKDEEWKRGLLEEAFEAASQSPIKWRVNYVSFPKGPLQGGLPRRILKAIEINNSGLDHLTLQTEIVRGMNLLQVLFSRR